MPSRHLGSLGRIAPTAEANLSQRIADRLAEARERTLLLVEPLADEQLNTVYSPILSPLAWDLGHIANFEELWLVQRVGDREPMDGELGRFYDAIENPRKTRNELPILRGDGAALLHGRGPRADARRARRRSSSTTAATRCSRTASSTRCCSPTSISTTRRCSSCCRWSTATSRSRVDASVAAEPVADGPEMVRVEAGSYEIGAAPEGFAYDNERPRHEVELDAFEIDRTPVTNGAFAEFVADTGAEPPMYWERDGEAAGSTTAFGRREPLDPALPVVHVDWHQADAFARWAGKRLPTELEWEAAAAGADRRARQPRPARLRLRAGRRLRRRRRPTAGAVQMLGDVWEWTSSDFTALPGLRGLPLSRSTRRSSSATPTRCCAAAPGRRAAT